MSNPENIQNLLENNKAWSDGLKENRPDYFLTLSQQQRPEYLWIGCSDSRVPANEIVGLLPGELFVHRNVANLVYATDLNCLSVLAYAVGVLRVRHIIVCGHYGCGGVLAAMQNQSLGLIDHWLTKIRGVYLKNRDELESLDGIEARADRLCELNVLDQVRCVSHTSVLQEAWSQGHQVTIHGWVYGLKDGMVNDLGFKISRVDQVDPAYRKF